MKFLVINGPNLNMMHFTEPGVAGQLDYNGLLDYLELCCTQMGLEVEFFQSNHEGDLIDEIQSAAGRADGIILNPGGYAHYSVAILDALRLCGVPAVEVLLSEPDEHEPFRKTDIVSFGWGGLADVFDPNKENWSAEYTQLKGLLTEEEYAAARASTLNAQ